MPAHLRAGEAVFQVIIEEVHDPLVKGRLIAFHGQA
jgi:hypothetical protein